MFDCPYCRRPLVIAISNHAVERLSERAYLLFFRKFKCGEDKAQFLARHCETVVSQGLVLKKRTEEDCLVIHYKNLNYVFKQCGKTLVLLTLYGAKYPKKRDIDPLGFVVDFKIKKESE